jgi:hypothetical protein
MYHWNNLTGSLALLLLVGVSLASSPVLAQSDEAFDSLQTAREPIIDRNVFSSQLRLEPVEIEAAPYQSINDILTAHVGVNKASGTSDIIRFRGGGRDGTDMIVDGVSQNNPYSNVPSYSINLDAIESIAIETSGFTAEYGNVRSGVINVTTRGDTGPPKLLNIDDTELARVAAAFVAIVELREAAQQGSISTEKFEEETVRAIRSQNISLTRYSEVIEAAQSNSKLQKRLVNLAREIASQRQNR